MSASDGILRTPEEKPVNLRDGRDESSTQNVDTIDDDRNRVVNIRDDDSVNEGSQASNCAVAASSAVNRLDAIETEATAWLVQNWERYVQHGTRNVQLGLQNLNLCSGEGLARIAAAEVAEEDPFAPIMFRHTHSSPLTQSKMFDDTEDLPPPAGLDQTRRSSSTPSISAFGPRSAGSAFGTNLRSLPYLNDDRAGSAFSLPMHRSSIGSFSDSGVRYSAFDPIPLQVPFDEETERTSIEVMDIGRHRRASFTDEDSPEQDVTKKSLALSAASRARKFLADVRLRRQKQRSGRENPARPPSTSSASMSNAQYEGDQENPSGSSSEGKEIVALSPNYQMSQTYALAKEQAKPGSNSSRKKKNAQRDGDGTQYQPLDSDVDEEEQFYQQIETKESNETDEHSPSPAYHQFVDNSESVTEESGQGVRIQISTITEIPQLTSQPTSTLLTPQRVFRSSSSHDSGAHSPGTAMSGLTSNTSGHATQGTSNSGQTIFASSTTTGSGSRFTGLSVVSETDLEVMATNKAGKASRVGALQNHMKRKQDADGTGSIHSSSTNSTNTHGYLALGGSPGPLRDGANLPTDRFFTQSAETKTGPGGAVGTLSDTNITPRMGTQRSSGIVSGGIHRDMSQLSTRTMAHAATSGVSAATSVGNTTTSSSSEEPPKFVSYLDRDRITVPTNSRISPETRISPQNYSPSTKAKDRESPAQIVGYSQMMFHTAGDTPGSKLLCPAKKRDSKSSSRPPLSPTKAPRTPTTPPPASHGYVDAGSPALSPPYIVNHRIQSSNLSKPYVLRSTQMMVAPEALRRSRTEPTASPLLEADIILEEESVNDAPLAYNPLSNSLEDGENSTPMISTYAERSVEIKGMSDPPQLRVVSPDKPRGVV